MAGADAGITGNVLELDCTQSPDPAATQPDGQ
jgi:hypothetical protein